MAERLTREQMGEKYPNQWIGITNVQYDNDNTTVAEADVIYTNKTASELGLMALYGEDVEPLFTTPNNVFQLGVLG